jgi:hypothetical protein
MVQNPHYPRPQPKKSGNGCLIAMLVVGGIFVLGGIFVGIGIYQFASSKEGKQIISVVGEGAKVAAEAQTAPGTSELKKLGCKQPMVMSMERLMKIAQTFNDAGSGEVGDLSVMVMCPVGLLDTPPGCDAVARTYVGAVPRPSASFAVTVSVQGKNQPHCSYLYAPDGTRTSEFGQQVHIPQ